VIDLARQCGELSAEEAVARFHAMVEAYSQLHKKGAP
jgi:hypothetical protein